MAAAAGVGVSPCAPVRGVSRPPETRRQSGAATAIAQSAPLRPVSAGATQASAWERLCALGANLTQEQREEIWFAAVDATGTDQVDMTPEGWAQVQAGIEARFGGAGGAPAAGQTAADQEDDLAF